MFKILTITLIINSSPGSLGVKPMPKNNKRARDASIPRKISAISPTENNYLFKKPHKITSVNDFALVALIDIECKLKNVEEAQRYLEILGALINEYNLFEKIPDLSPFYYSRKAAILILQNKQTEALELLKYAEKEASDDQFLKAFILSKKGVVNKQQQKYGAAINDFNHALACNFDNIDLKIEILKLLASVEAKSNALNEAWQHIKQAIILNNFKCGFKDEEVYSVGAEICFQKALKTITMSKAIPPTVSYSQGQSFCLYPHYKTEKKAENVLNPPLYAALT